MQNTKQRVFFVLICLSMVMSTGCHSTRRRSMSAHQVLQAKQAVSALQQADFARAGKEAAHVIQEDHYNPQARIVAAFAEYHQVAHNLVRDAMTVVAAALVSRFAGPSFNEQYVRWSLTKAEQGLATVETHLAVAAHSDDLSLELCMACWQRDWNHNGRLDRFDERLFQIEMDETGARLPADHPRRRPTFRFDVGDVAWARAMIGFQRALLNGALAYDFSEVMQAFQRRSRRPQHIKFALVEPQRVQIVKQQLLHALSQAKLTRQLYLQEDDDDREWVPNPRQQNHPMPLKADETLYRTWETVINELEHLLQGTRGLSVAELAQLGDHRWENPPDGSLNLATWFENPKAISIDLQSLKRFERMHNHRNKEAESKMEAEHLLRGIFGQAYVPHMPPSGLVQELARMKGEMERGEESFERKLRYLLWLN